MLNVLISKQLITKMKYIKMVLHITFIVLSVTIHV